jgi:hypothetical protein
MSLSKFIILKHEAKRAGLHTDFRFRIPASRKWASFAVRKGVPTEPRVKVLAIRTKDHTEYGALLTGKIGSGYGAGRLTKIDSGYCDVEKYSSTHIVLNLRGNHFTGIYHFLSTGVIDRNYENKSYLLFKGAVMKENFDIDAMGMMGRVPPLCTQEEEMTDEEADTQSTKSLSWSKGGNNLVNKISLKEVQIFIEDEELKLLVDQEEVTQVQEEIIKFFVSHPNPPDDDVHALADKLQLNPHEFESKIYALLGSFLGYGRSKDFKGSYDPEELKMGIEVEKEHTNNAIIAERIAKDHLAEIPNYYTRLKKMEGSAGIKD